MDKKKLRERIEPLSKEQTVYFAWRCTVLALPFLGSNGNFNYWDKKVRQKHIYSIFHVLDVCSVNYPADDAADATAAAVKAADDAAKAAAYAVNAGYAKAYTTAKAVAYAAAAAAKAADTVAKSVVYAANADYAAAAKVAKAADDAAADAAYAAAEAANGTEKKIDLESIFLKDLHTIQNNGEGGDPHKLTNLYGELMDNFQKALDAEGCLYWGRLYKSIFDAGFKWEPEKIRGRASVPKEIQEQGAASVATYLEESEVKGAVRLNEARIIILGDKGTGKTCIARRLIAPEALMTTDDESTAGVDTTLWKLKDKNINVRIWDFAGHTVTHAVHQFFLSERSLYLMVYDGRTEERNRLEYWLNHMKNYGGDSQSLILVNKRDQHCVDIPINSLKEQYPIVGFYTFSIKDDLVALKTFRNEVSGYIIDNPSWKMQEIPLNYYQVKDQLENLFENSREHITKDEFNKIAEEYDVKNIEELLKNLHFLGVSLWYRDMEEFDKLVLNPEWISHGVYKIINWVNEAKKYSLKLNDFATVFKEDGNRYPVKEHKFLFELMKRYELAYETDGEDLIIPHLLKEDRPAELPDFPVGESLMLKYESKQPLPSDPISRFIVRHNQEIKQDKNNDLVWRHGVVLEDGNGSIALVRKEDRSISVSVKGGDKTKYISVLRKTLNDIFNSYKSEKPELKYRIEQFGQLEDAPETTNPLWLSDRNICKHYNREKPYYDVNTDKDIPMAPIMNFYNIKAENVIAGGRDSQLAIDNSTHFNFYDCNISLQSGLNELSQLLTEAGNKEEAKDLENVATVLEQVETSKNKEEVKKKGIANRLKRLVDDLNNKESKLHNIVNGVKNGVSIAQDIGKGYNDIAQWVGWPQVPTPFLK